MKFGESEQQQSLIYWARLSVSKYPQLAFLHASMNGAKRTKEAGIAKANGMLAGVPDLFLPVKNKSYSGLFIEMKFGKNKLTVQQAKFLKFADIQGFKTAVCYSWVEAKDILVEYLDNIN